MYKKSITERIKKSLPHHLMITGIVFVLSFIIYTGIIYMSLIPVTSEFAGVLFSDIRVFFMNFTPVFLTALFVRFLTQSYGVSFLIPSVLSFLICYANRMKVLYRDDPLVFSDLLLANEAGEMLKNYPLLFEAVSVISAFMICAVTVALFIFFKKTKKKKSERITLVERFSGTALMLVLFLLFSNTLIIKNTKIYNSTWHEEFGNPLKPANHCMSRGTVYYFIRSVKNVSSKPDGYDENKAKKTIEEFETVPLPEDKKVNIISIMLEAYNDFSRFPSVEFNINPYEQFNELKKASYSGLLYTNIFAADTIRTERSFLTGFGDIDYSKDTESYVRYFKNQGYYTEAMHPCYGWFYNRRNVNKYLGFDNFLYYENNFGSIPEEKLYEAKYDGMIADIDFFEYVLQGYAAAVAEGKKYFNFSVTYQNHGPYSTEKYTEKEFLVKKDSYPPDMYNVLNNYFANIKRTDDALKKLRDYADSSKEPLLLILFGDHNPMLGNGKTGYELLGVDIDTTTVEGAENYYCTPYIFYANDAAKKALGRNFVGEGKTVSPIFLMNELFEYAGLEGPAYMNYLKTIKDEYDVVNVLYLGKDGKYTKRDEADTETLTHRQWVEYYLKNRKEEQQ